MNVSVLSMMRSCWWHGGGEEGERRDRSGRMMMRRT